MAVFQELQDDWMLWCLFHLWIRLFFAPFKRCIQKLPGECFAYDCAKYAAWVARQTRMLGQLAEVPDKGTAPRSGLVISNTDSIYFKLNMKRMYENLDL